MRLPSATEGIEVVGDGEQSFAAWKQRRRQAGLAQGEHGSHHRPGNGQQGGRRHHSSSAASTSHTSTASDSTGPSSGIKRADRACRKQGRAEVRARPSPGRGRKGRGASERTWQEEADTGREYYVLMAFRVFSRVATTPACGTLDCRETRACAASVLRIYAPSHVPGARPARRGRVTAAP